MHVTASAGTDVPAKADRRAWLGLAVLALATLLLSFDVTLLYLAAPQLSADLDPSSTQMLWIMDIYSFMLAGLMVTMGTLGDRIGRRKVLLAGAVAFGAASLLAAYAPSAESLIAARALLGVAGAAIMPSTLSLTAALFRDPRQRAFAMGIWAAAFSVGIALGPVIGGLMLEAFWWGSVFLLAVPIMGVLLVAGPLVLPDYRNPGAGRLDLVSVVLSMAAILPVVYGIKQMAKHGVDGVSVGALVLGAVMGVWFALRQRRLANPLLDLSLFSNRSFSAALGTSALVGAALGGTYLFITQYLQLVEELSPLESGLWLVPGSLALIGTSMLAPVLTRRVRPAYVLAVSMLVSAVGYALLTQVGDGGLAVMITGFILLYAGTGPEMALATDLVVGSAPPEKAGSASAMHSTGGELGIAFGVAVIGSIGTAVYRDELSGKIPESVPADAASAAEDSMAAAHAAAAELPDDVGQALMEPARDAFVSGLGAVSVVATALIVALVGLVLVALRHVPPSGTGASDPGDTVPDDSPTATDPANAGSESDTTRDETPVPTGG
ncbi:MFS transporter [Yinghuangia sp. YIM S09857]|uniref:MFS transporter n=1 Tax=Yinghuangia sp. YIM S09857 TaxID=3436929 RepID=UPI003F53E3B3